MRLSRRLGMVAAMAALVSMTTAGCATSGGGGSSSTSSAKSGEGKTITMLRSADSTHAAQYKTWTKDVAATFKKNTGANLVFENFSSSDDEMKKIQTSVVSGQGPDVYSLGSTLTPFAQSTGAFMTMTDADWQKIGGKDKFVPGALAMSGSSEDKLIGIPQTSQPYVLAYNTKMFKQAGIAAPPKTWDQFVADAKKLTDPSKGVYGAAVGYGDSYDTWKYIWAMSNELGNPLVKDNKAMLDSPEVETAYRTFFDWMTKDKIVDPKSYSWTTTEALGAFENGKAAMVPVTNSSGSVSFNSSMIKDDWSFATIPTVAPGHTKNPPNGKPAGSIISGNNLVIADYSKNKDLDLELVRELTTPTAQENYYKLFGNLPTTKEGLAKVTSNDPKMAAVSDASKGSLPTPYVGAWSDIQMDLENVTVQAESLLSKGNVPDSYISSSLKKANQSAQASLDRSAKQK